MSFSWDIHQFTSIAALAAHLKQLGSITWYTGVTVHHTAIPTVAQWRGRDSMIALGNYYRDDVPNPDGTKGWSAGPHFFVGPDGIWTGTPITHRGVHAVSFNRSHIGVEVVGDYDKQSWPEPICSYVYDLLELLLRRRSLPATALNGHRNDPQTTKHCPGKAIDLNFVRRELHRRLAGATYRVRADGSRIRAEARITSRIVRRCVENDRLTGVLVEGESYQGINRWLKTREGYMWSGLVEEVRA
jgi:hypothetical protein